jgi:hypothetical protein
VGIKAIITTNAESRPTITNAEVCLEYLTQKPGPPVNAPSMPEVAAAGEPVVPALVAGAAATAIGLAEGTVDFAKKALPVVVME